jgi:methyl-accepting chemotaxis protein
MIYLPHFVASLILGIATAYGLHFASQALLPPMLLVGLTALAAILPGMLIFFLMVTRPLAQLTQAIEQSASSEDFRQFADTTVAIPGQHCRRLRVATLALQDKVMRIARDVAERGGRIAVASANVSFSADALKKKLSEQVRHANAIGSTSQQIAETTEAMSVNAERAQSAASATHDASAGGQHAVRDAIEHIHHVRAETERSATSLGELQVRSEEIQTITHIIDGVAEQTNLLALNAAIEAARAGEHGRGFAVVADEVRQLASKTTEATREIGEKLASIHQGVNDSVQTMQQLVAVVENVVTDTEQVGSVLQGINGYSEESAGEIGLIASAVQGHVDAIAEITGSLGGMEQALSLTEDEVQQVSDRAVELSDSAETVYKAIAHFELGTVHDQVRHLALEAAARIGEVFEEAIAAGRVSLNDLMDRNYQAIPDTNPPKYKTRFDAFTDQLLPAIQEPILERHDFILYAGAVDDNGYFPTHNRRYSQPLTGDYQRDLVSNRTKRIFDDRTGSRCGSSTEPFLLQTYKRDTGEIMHDMSVPIRVQGRHWGGFRIGYRAESGA